MVLLWLLAVTPAHGALQGGGDTGGLLSAAYHIVLHGANPSRFHTFFELPYITAGRRVWRATLRARPNVGTHPSQVNHASLTGSSICSNVSSTMQGGGSGRLLCGRVQHRAAHAG